MICWLLGISHVVVDHVIIALGTLQTQYGVRLSGAKGLDFTRETRKPGEDSLLQRSRHHVCKLSQICCAGVMRIRLPETVAHVTAHTTGSQTRIHQEQVYFSFSPQAKRTRIVCSPQPFPHHDPSPVLHHQLHPQSPAMTSRSERRRNAAWSDLYRPSVLKLRLKLGPEQRPSMVLEIAVYFAKGQLPHIKVRAKWSPDRGDGDGERRDRRRRRRRRAAEDYDRGDGDGERRDRRRRRRRRAAEDYDGE